MKALHPFTRLLLAVAVLSMISGYFLPLWEIQLWAPQYPEGLNMKIWLDHISGDYEIINGLNHYIGMKHIKQEMFPEFGYMGYALALLIGAGLLPVIFGRYRLLFVFVIILFVGAGLGIYDFYRWGYDYGHNLDPKAAISVPGMSYQPPIIGYKSLLNFVAYSGPDRGGWVLIVAGVISTLLLAWEISRRRKFARLKHAATSVIPLLAMLIVLPGCDSSKVAIEYGKDDCAECKMLLVDRHYGTAFVTDKGKVFKFDDINCLLKFINGSTKPQGKAMVINFPETNHFLPVEEAVFLRHSKLRTPMNSGLAAFSDKEAADVTRKELGEGGEILSWDDVIHTELESCQCDP